MPTIMHLTVVHKAFDNRIFHKECQSLHNHGYRVMLVAPHGQSETVQGVEVIALPTVSHRLLRFFKGSAQILQTALAQKADLYHLHDPELIPVALILRMMGKRVVYDLHEDLPRQVMHKEWIPDPLKKPVSGIVEWIENVAYKFMSGIVAAEPVIMKRFTNHKRIALVQNFPKLEEASLTQGAPKYKQREPNVVYIGGISKARGAFEMIDAIQKLSGGRLVLGGSASEKLLEEMRQKAGWAKTTYLGWLSREQVASTLAAARVGLVVLNPTPKYIDAWPTKLFEYMMFEVPVVSSDFPLWRSIVEDAQCGILVDPTDTDAIAAATQSLLDNPEKAEQLGKNGRKAILEKYNWGKEEQKLIAFYQDLLGRSGLRFSEENKADQAVAPLKINPSREKVEDQ